MTDGNWYWLYLVSCILLGSFAAAVALGLLANALILRRGQRPSTGPTATEIEQRRAQLTAWLSLPVLAYVSGGILAVGLGLLLEDLRQFGGVREALEMARGMSSPFGAPMRGLWVLLGGLIFIEAVAFLVNFRRDEGRVGKWRNIEAWGVLRQTLREASSADVASREWRKQALLTRRHLRTNGGGDARRQARALALLRSSSSERDGVHGWTRRPTLWAWREIPWSVVARWSLRRPYAPLLAILLLAFAAAASVFAWQVREYDGAAGRSSWIVALFAAGMLCHCAWLRFDVLAHARAGRWRESVEEECNMLLRASLAPQSDRSGESRLFLQIGNWVLSRDVGGVKRSRRVARGGGAA